VLCDFICILHLRGSPMPAYLTSILHRTMTYLSLGNHNIVNKNPYVKWEYFEIRRAGILRCDMRKKWTEEFICRNNVLRNASAAAASMRITRDSWRTKLYLTAIAPPLPLTIKHAAVSSTDHGGGSGGAP
jgi:hypothetical protein